MTGDALPPLASSSSSSLSTTTASYTRYEVVPSSYATTHAIRSSSSSSKVLTVDLPSPDSGIGADAVTPRQDHHPPTALHQVSFNHYRLLHLTSDLIVFDLDPLRFPPRSYSPITRDQIFILDTRRARTFAREPFHPVDHFPSYVDFVPRHRKDVPDRWQQINRTTPTIKRYRGPHLADITSSTRNHFLRTRWNRT